MGNVVIYPGVYVLVVVGDDILRSPRPLLACSPLCPEKNTNRRRLRQCKAGGRYNNGYAKTASHPSIHLRRTVLLACSLL